MKELAQQAPVDPAAFASASTVRLPTPPLSAIGPPKSQQELFSSIASSPPMGLLNMVPSSMDQPSLMQQLSMPGSSGISTSLPALMTGPAAMSAATNADASSAAAAAALSTSGASAAKTTSPLASSNLSGAAALSSTAGAAGSGVSPPGGPSSASTGTVTVPLTDRFLALNPLGPQPLTPLQQYQQRVLDGVVRRLPVPADTQRANRFVPRLLSPPYPSSYPTVPLPNSDSLEFFMKLQPETLFFIFYYYQV